MLEVSRGLSMYIKDKKAFTYVSRNHPNAIPLVQQMNSNNGIHAYIDSKQLPNKFKKKIEAAGKVSINPDQPLSYYQPNAFIGNSVIIVDTSNLTKNQALFIVSEIKRIRTNSTWNDKFPKEQVKTAVITLPVKNKQIDFDFMEAFIAEIEAEHIAELEAEKIAKLDAYLKVSGLEDYELTKAEENALNEFKNENIKCLSLKLVICLKFSQLSITNLKMSLFLIKKVI